MSKREFLHELLDDDELAERILNEGAEISERVRKMGIAYKGVDRLTPRELCKQLGDLINTLPDGEARSRLVALATQACDRVPEEKGESPLKGLRCSSCGPAGWLDFIDKRQAD